MGLAHEMEHLKKDIGLWRVQMRLARELRTRDEEQHGSLTLRCGRARDLKQLEQAHLQIFRAPLLPFLRWTYRFKAPELVSLADDGQGKIIGYDLFMFQEAELGRGILHEIYVGVIDGWQGQGIATALRLYSVKAYRGARRLRGLSTLAPFDDIKALRTAQRAGFAITKTSAKPPAYYLYQSL